MTVPALAEAVAEILRELDAEIAARQPVCDASGKCCHFEAYGHRLYVTRAELDYFASVMGSAVPARRPTSEKRSTPLPLLNEEQTFNPGCPYQIAGLCTARQARPMGCRVYFCDPNAQAWQNEVYERYHARLKALHEKFGLPYQYLEWRQGLRMLAEEMGEDFGGTRGTLGTTAGTGEGRPR